MKGTTSNYFPLASLILLFSISTISACTSRAYRIRCFHYDNITRRVKFSGFISRSFCNCSILCFRSSANTSNILAEGFSITIVSLVYAIYILYKCTILACKVTNSFPNCQAFARKKNGRASQLSHSPLFKNTEILSAYVAVCI